MNDDNEKMVILRMLQDGIITASEAKGLLDAVEDDKPSSSDSTTSEKDYEKEENPLSGWGTKFEHMKKDFAPKLHKLTEIVVEKTATVADIVTEKTTTVADKISKSFDLEYMGEEQKKSYKNMPERIFELEVAEGYNELKLSSFNEATRISGCSGNRIMVKVTYSQKSRNPNLNFIKKGREYELEYEEHDFDFVLVEAFVPERLFRNMNIQSVNGEINLLSINSEYISISNLNAGVNLKSVESEIIKVDVNNGFLNAVNVISKSGKIEVSNGAVDCVDFDVEDLYIQNFNGVTNINISSFKKFKEYMYNIDTRNGKVTMVLPSSVGVGYYIKGQASLSNVKLGLKDVEHIKNSGDYVEAKSADYDAFSKHMVINARTSNAPLNIR